MTRTIIQLYRGTTAQNDAFTGAVGELTMDTTTNELRLHDGSTVGGHVIGSGGGSGGYHPDLFDCKWADHICNDVQWLRADTFSWQSGAVYQAAYQHLADDITGKTLQSETISGTTIQFYLADDGHKICPASEESNVTAIYNATGVAWYYILDTANTRFKLPRTQFGFTGIRSGVGGFVEAGLPNITGNIGYSSLANQYGTGADNSALYQTIDSVYGGQANNNNRGIVHLDASRSNSIYGNSDTVQPKATEMYLYFYVGNFTQTALENTAGLNAELFNGKADVSTVAHVVTEFQEPTAANNYTWYRKYADGWVEQGGRTSHSNSQGVSTTITLPIEMSDTNYCVFVASGRTDGINDAAKGIGFSIVNALSFIITMYTPSGWGSKSTTFSWEVKGIAAQ